MTTFVLLTKLSKEISRSAKERLSAGNNWLEAVERVCPGIRWIGHYHIIGPFNYMDIYEAPDEETAAKVLYITLSLGAERAENWPAIPYGRFKELADQIAEVTG